MKQLATLFLLIILPSVVLAQAHDDLRTVTVTGNAIHEVSPDQAVIHATIEARNASAEFAKEKGDQILNDVMAFLALEGMTENQVTTQHAATQPEYRYEARERILTGYVSRYSLEIEVDDFDKVGKLYTRLVELGVTRVNNVHYRLKDRAAAEAEALAMAAVDAQKKASKVATALGKTLGDVLSVNDSRSDFHSPRPMPMARTMMAMDSAESAKGAEINAPKGLISIHQQIFATFTLR